MSNRCLFKDLFWVVLFINLFINTPAHAQSDTSGTISGSVVDKNGQAVSLATVIALDFVTGNFVDFGLTDRDGAFRIRNLSPGRYSVGVKPSGPGLAVEFFDNVTNLAFADPVTVSAGNDTSISFTLGPGGSISGKALDTNNNPIESRVKVVAVDFFTGGFESFGISDTSGNFTIHNLPPGLHSVIAIPFSSNHAVEFYEEVGDLSKAKGVQVEAGVETSGINFTHGPAGSLSGKVVDATNNPLPNIIMAALDFSSGGFVHFGITNGQGEFKIEHLSPRLYAVIANPAVRRDLSIEFFDNVTNLILAGSVNVSVGNNTPDINFTLNQGGLICGNVQTIAGIDLPRIKMIALDFLTGGFVNAVFTRADGSYEIPNLFPGQYAVIADPLGNDLAVRFFEDAPNLGQATPVGVTPEGSNCNTSFTLSSGGSISGRVVDRNSQPLGGIKVVVMDFSTGSFVNLEFTDGSGNFTIPNLPPGAYAVAAVPSPETGLASVFYNNVASRDLATPVIVAQREVVNLAFNLILAPAGSISGNVKDINGNPLAGLSVNAFEFDTSAWVSSGRTDSSGNFTISGLVSGDYKVGISNASIGDISFIDQFYNNARWNTANRVTVPLGGNVSGIDFILLQGVFIKGNVVTADNGLPVSNIPVNAFIDHKDWVGSGNTNGVGSYAIRVAANGIYNVGVDVTGTAFQSIFYNNKPDLESADNIEVGSIDKGGIDFIVSVAPGPTVTPTPTPAPGATATPTPTLAPGATVTPTPELTPTPTPAPTPTPTPTPGGVSPDPRTQGYWKRQCEDNPQEDIRDEYVDFVNNFSHFSAVQTKDDVCAILDVPNQSSMCDKADAQFMALLLNLASNKLDESDCVKTEDPQVNTTVGAVANGINAILEQDSPTNDDDSDDDSDDSDDDSDDDCKEAKTLADDINNGSTLCGVEHQDAGMPERFIDPFTLGKGWNIITGPKSVGGRP